VDEFETINDRLKTIITKWQTVEIAGRTLPNDHTDVSYDQKVIDQLIAVDEKTGPVLERLATGLPRLAAYRTRLTDALEHVMEGKTDWVSDLKVPSYHSVWFELHDDLLRLLGRERQE